MRRTVCPVAFCLAILAGEVASAQPVAPATPENCDQKAAAAKSAWAQNPHGDLANVFHAETFGIGDTWCRIWETTGTDRRFKAGDFGRVLFTGDGVHPSVSSSLVPGSGFAAGASFTIGQNLSSRSLRLSESVDGRFATNGSTSFSGRLDVLGSGNRFDNRHNNATFVVERQQLAQLDYFGQGNDSNVTNQSAYALNRTVAGGMVEMPLPYGFFVSGQMSGLWMRPSPTAGLSVPPIEVRFTSGTAATPASDTSTSYLVYGGALRWKYPLDAVTGGYATETGGTVREFRELGGLPFSFTGVDLAWTNQYAPNSWLGQFSFNSFASLSIVPDGHSVPFYLQPTVGGTDLNGFSVLRSFNDYRFRAPNRVAIILEHEHNLLGPIGSLFFADWAQVSTAPSTLTLDAFHRSFGAGVTVRVGNVTVLRAFYAWGGGEGTRTTFTGSSDSFAAVLNRRTLF